MNLQRKLRDCFIRAVGEGGRPPIKQLRDFFLDIPEDLEVHELAGKALAYFATSDGKFNSNLTALLAVLTFLHESTGTAPNDITRKDLKNVLNKEPSEQSLIAWAKSHFP